MKITIKNIDKKNNDYWNFVAKWFYENEEELYENLEDSDATVFKIKNKEKAIKFISEEMKNDTDMWESIREVFCDKLENYCELEKEGDI